MEIQTPELLKTLSNKTNLEIINLLKNEPSYPRKISEILGMQEAYISRVLTQLEKLGILCSRWVYRERNVKLYSVDTEEINITFEPEGLKIHVRTKGEREISVSYDAFTFEVPETHMFTGRERELDLLERSPIIVIEGIAGIGKTYLASKYVQKLQKEGKKIFWHTFTEIDSFHYLINKLSVFLNNVGYSNLLEYIKQEGKDARVLLSLFQQGISDDMGFCFDGFQQVRDKDIVALFRLLKNVQGKIIITTRERPSFLSISRTDIGEIRLSALSERESLVFLHSRGVPLENGELQNAHHRLGGHPLILDMFCEAVREKRAADLLESLPVDRVEDYLWSEIVEKFSESERQLVECLSMLRVPASPSILNQIYKSGRFWTILRGLEKRMIIKKQNGNYVLPSMIKEFTYQKVPHKEELHKQIAPQYLAEGTPEGLLEAMYHFLQAGDQERAAEIVAQPRDVDLIERGYLSSYMELLKQFSKSDVSPEHWCSITYAKGRVLVLYGDLKNALTEFSEMQETAQSIDSQPHYARALNQLGNMYAVHGNWKKAHQCFEESLTLLETLKDYRMMVDIHADIGNLLLKQNRFKEALSHFEAGKEIAERIGCESGVAKMLRHIGNIYYHQDQFDTALQHEMQSLNLAEKSLDTRGAAASYNSVGLVYFYREEFEEAVKWFEKDKGIAERISDLNAKITSYGNLGMVYQELQEDEKAREYYENALKLAEELEDPYYTTYLKMKIAHLLLQRDEVEKARLLCEGCLEIFEQLGETLHYGEFCRVYGMILHEIGKWEEARGLYERSMEELSDSPLDLGKTYLEYSLGLKKEEDTKAKEYYSIALQLFEKVCAKREMEKAKKRWESEEIT
jgi:tetratricopeptide (TPR) repeat protein/DNA-binding transcriptional ArsR family regulator